MVIIRGESEDFKPAMMRTIDLDGPKLVVSLEEHQVCAIKLHKPEEIDLDGLKPPKAPYLRH